MCLLIFQFSLFGPILRLLLVPSSRRCIVVFELLVSVRRCMSFVDAQTFELRVHEMTNMTISSSSKGGSIKEIQTDTLLKEVRVKRIDIDAKEIDETSSPRKPKQKQHEADDDHERTQNATKMASSTSTTTAAGQTEPNEEDVLARMRARAAKRRKKEQAESTQSTTDAATASTSESV